MYAVQYPPRKEGQLALGLQAESFLTNVARQTAMKMAAYQQEWGVEKMKNKLLEYLHKAAKSSDGNVGLDVGRNWEKIIEDFALRFLQAFWGALWDRNWINRVDINDLALCVQTSCIAYFPNSDLRFVVNQPEYSKCCADETERAFDTCRYSSWGWQVFKDTLSSKAAQKKVGGACDAARKKVIGTKPDSAEAFVKSWVKLTIDQLAESGNLHEHMTEVQAIKLFNKLIQEGGGIPTNLLRMNGGKPPQSCNEISDLVEEAYQAHPPPTAASTDSWGGEHSWGSDSWEGWDIGAFMNLMGAKGVQDVGAMMMDMGAKMMDAGAKDVMGGKGGSYEGQPSTSAASNSSKLDSNRRRKSGWHKASNLISTQGYTRGMDETEIHAERDPVERSLWMRDHHIGRVMGRHGIGNGVRERNNVAIRVGPKERGGSQVFISGDRYDVDRAVATIREWLTSRRGRVPDVAQEEVAKHAGEPLFVGVRSRRKLRLYRRLKELVRHKKQEEYWRAVSEGRPTDINVNVHFEGRGPQASLEKYQSDCAVLWKKCQTEGLLLTKEDDVGSDALWIWPARWNLVAPTLFEIEEIFSAFGEIIASIKAKNDSARAAWSADNPKPKQNNNCKRGGGEARITVEKEDEQGHLTALGEAQLLQHLRDGGWARAAEDTCGFGDGEGGGPVASDRREPVDGDEEDDADVGIGSASAQTPVDGSQQLPSFIDDHIDGGQLLATEEDFDAVMVQVTESVRDLAEEDVHDKSWTDDEEDNADDVSNGIASGEESSGDEWAWVAGADAADVSDPDHTQHKLLLPKPKVKAGWKARQQSDVASRSAATTELLEISTLAKQRRAASSQLLKRWRKGVRRRERSRSPNSRSPITRQQIPRRRAVSAKLIKKWRKMSESLRERSRSPHSRSPSTREQIPTWACSACGFTNAPRNKICGGYGPLGCKAPREQVGEAKPSIGISRHPVDHHTADSKVLAQQPPMVPKAPALPPPMTSLSPWVAKRLRQNQKTKRQMGERRRERSRSPRSRSPITREQIPRRQLVSPPVDHHTTGSKVPLHQRLMVPKAKALPPPMVPKKPADAPPQAAKRSLQNLRTTGQMGERRIERSRSLHSRSPITGEQIPRRQLISHPVDHHTTDSKVPVHQQLMVPVSKAPALPPPMVPKGPADVPPRQPWCQSRQRMLPPTSSLKFIGLHDSQPRPAKQALHNRKTSGQMGESQRERSRSPKNVSQVRTSFALDNHKVLASAPWRNG